MLRASLLTLGQGTCVRRFHRFQRLLQDKPLDLEPKVPEQEEDASASVKEHMIFGSIFERMQQKEEERLRQTSELLTGEKSSGKPGNDVRVNFGQNERETRFPDVDPADISLVEYFKKEGEKQQMLRGSQPSAKSTIIYDLFENLEQTIQNNRKRTLEKSDAMKIDSFAPGSLQNVQVNNSSLLKVDVKKLEAEERYRVAMEGVMQPYMSQLEQEDGITDYTLLEHIQSLLQQFTSRNGSLDTLNRDNQPVEIINTIKQWNEKHPGKLPEPLIVTIPYVVLQLLTSPKFRVSSPRRYSLALYVYNQCKNCQDLSLYLNMCDAAFYNVLLELSWENDRSVHRLVELTAEMTTNGILGDLETVSQLDGVVSALETTYDDYVPLVTEDAAPETQVHGVLWSRRTRNDLSQLQNYLRHLKQRLTVSQ